MKIDTGTKELNLVKIENFDVTERIRYLRETRQDVVLTVTAKYGENVVIDINDPKPESAVAPVVEEPKKPKSAK